MRDNINQRPSEDEVVNAFVTLGLNEKQARILTFTLRHTEGVTQHELERSLDLRQPEVSMGLGPLLDNHWIRIADRIRAKDGRSRPVNIYAPGKDPQEIVQDLYSAFQERCNLIQQSFAIIAKV